MRRVDLSDQRREYLARELDERDAPATPWPLVERWLDEALQLQLPDATAMTLATVSSDGQPSARVVLLKGVDERGLRFFTRYSTRKAEQLTSNPKAALSVFHTSLDRQIHFEGSVTRVSREESAAYFKTRPRASQLSAAAVSGLREVVDRADLEQRVAHLAAQLGQQPVPLPEDWGGYVLAPERVEFWQGRPSRLHDRLLYATQADGTWRRTRLAP